MTAHTRPRPTAADRTYRTHARPAWRRILVTRETALIALLAAVLLYANAAVDNFGGPLTMYYLFLDVTPLLLIALPMTLVIITGEIDLSVASVVGLSSVLLGVLYSNAGMPVWAAALAAIAVGAVCGSLNGFLVAYVGLPSLAVTIGALALYRGIAVGLLGTEAVTDFPELWTDLARMRIVEGSGFPAVLVLFAVLALATAWLLHFSPFGRGIFEIGLNREAAHFTGVNVERTKFLLFTLTGAISALAGVYFTLRYGSARGDNAAGLELQVIAAVLLGGVSIFGGRGAVHGPIAGVILIGAVSSAMRLEGQTVNVINIVIGVLLVASVVAAAVFPWVTAKRAARNPYGKE
ncbi:ABC transporter permease [Glycomyces albus]